jgi:hypothetical protein
MKSSLPMVAFLTFVAIALGIAPGEPGSNSIESNGAREKPIVCADSERQKALRAPIIRSERSPAP